MTAFTNISVRVIANDGKFIGDDIGGAAITIRNADTREILAQGTTRGGSGPNGNGGVMCARLARGQPIPTDASTSVFATTLSLTTATRIEVAANGPLGARSSANTVSVTTWMFPGRDMTAGNGLLLLMPGLVCQIINPPTHTVFKQPGGVEIVANVAMMCGCPISDKTKDAICPGDDQPWLPKDFEVFAILPLQQNDPICLPMFWDAKAGTPGRFTATWSDAVPGTYLMTVVAQQKSTGNTGVDSATFVVNSVPSKN